MGVVYRSLVNDFIYFQKEHVSLWSPTNRRRSDSVFVSSDRGTDDVGRHIGRIEQENRRCLVMQSIEGQGCFGIDHLECGFYMVYQIVGQENGDEDPNEWMHVDFYTIEDFSMV